MAAGVRASVANVRPIAYALASAQLSSRTRHLVSVDAVDYDWLIATRLELRCMLAISPSATSGAAIDRLHAPGDFVARLPTRSSSPHAARDHKNGQSLDTAAPTCVGSRRRKTLEALRALACRHSAIVERLVARRGKPELLPSLEDGRFDFK